MSFPTPPDGHAFVIAKVNGRLYAIDLILEEMNWEATRPHTAWHSAGQVFGMPGRWSDRLTLTGIMAETRIYDPSTGQTRDEQEAIEPPREELEP